FNLGLAYFELSEGDRVQNLQHAVDHYRAALRVVNEHTFAYQWANTVLMLGAAYASLSKELKEVSYAVLAKDYLAEAVRGLSFFDLVEQQRSAQNMIAEMDAFIEKESSEGS